MNHTISFVLAIFFFLNVSFKEADQSKLKNNVILENSEFSLVISSNGTALSLYHKPTAQECLQEGVKMPMFSITQYRPYQVEHFLNLPSKPISFFADSVYMEGDNLIVHFEEIMYKAIIAINITDSYISFQLKNIEQLDIETYQQFQIHVSEFTLLQLPVRKREYFGDWLNVSWDEEVAVNLLAIDPYCRIDADERDGFHIMKAEMEKNVKLFDVGAALITTSTDKLLDNIDQLEKDYELPRGVESRRSEIYKYSYYWGGGINKQNIDEHITFAKQGGFRAFMMSYTSFSSSAGHFPWNSEYPNGMDDLRLIVNKIENAGMIPGIHIHYNKARINDEYVTPVPDPRLNLSHTFTLSESVDISATSITVEENPEACTMTDRRRILKLGNELIAYEAYTTTPPYRFTGCERGYMGTKVADHPKGIKFGLLDVDDWPIFIRFDQKTSIQKEVAEKIAEIYADAGFRFVYFDGAEDVHPPYWHHVAKSQWEVYKVLDPAPLFSEAAAKSHFSWHMISRGNAYDTFPPETIKRRTKIWKVRDAKRTAKDFTRVNFGWNGYTVPGKETIGTQPDMYEYVYSQAVAWDCPVSLNPRLDRLKAHPRTSDNLEAMRRWEEARLSGFFSNDQIKMLQNADMDEHILLINETGGFELQPYKHIQDAAGGNPAIRAFIFERSGKTCIVFWHPSGEGTLELNVDKNKVRLFKQLGREIPFKGSRNVISIPYGDRQYLEIDLTKDKVLSIFRDARIL